MQQRGDLRLRILHRHPILALPITTVATFVIASLSWRLLEQPFLHLKRYFEVKTVRPNPAGEQLSVLLRRKAPAEVAGRRLWLHPYVIDNRLLVDRCSGLIS
jgi:peptidoglycan/LPS O-acetylase OafA/YrhL